MTILKSKTPFDNYLIRKLSMKLILFIHSHNVFKLILKTKKGICFKNLFSFLEFDQKFKCFYEKGENHSKEIINFENWKLKMKWLSNKV